VWYHIAAVDSSLGDLNDLPLDTQTAILDAWNKYKAAKAPPKEPAGPKEPKKPKTSKKGGKVPTPEQAEKAVRKWKISDVTKFLTLADDTHLALKGYLQPQKILLGTEWDNLPAFATSDIVQAYIAFMKEKHGLESVAEEAEGYVVEAKGPRYPMIVRRDDHEADGGRDLYHVVFKEGGREYCYALGPSLRSYIERVQGISPAKAASIVKARSAGEYDCDTGDLLTPRARPDEGPAEVQTTLFDEATDAVDRRGLSIVREEADVDAVLRATAEPRGMGTADREVVDELRSGGYPDEAEDGKAFVFHWADGRGTCAFKRKADAIAWIEDDANHPGGPEIVGWWYDEPYCPRRRRDAKHRLRVAGSYEPKERP